MKFILTGHKGLIGSFLLERLKAQGHEPLLLIDKRDNQDIIEIGKHQLTEKADMFIHLAAFCKINKTIEEPQLAFDNNVLGMHEVMEFCRKNKIPKMVFASSSRVESKEKNPYTASKVYGEELVKAYAECYGIDYVIIRPSTVYGPFNDLTKRLIDVYIINALQGEELKIFGNENKTLDTTYIDDFIDGTLMAMEQTNKEYDLSAGKGIKASYIADLIIKLAGQGTKAFYPPEIAQPQEVELDILPIKAIGYEPKVSIEEGIKKTFEWYKKNLDEILKSRN
ncbi:MAG: NAD-dependent epimerase/dehydratase family protein [Nanoarchaeota archaeon]|nr:NAD-dependent epimerase/dehydratase family protein [Nanoarchaeota archaeon]MBU1051054.1 NAD-dependent epimerase/dehydratase family protein [Nanoarchaeota archaeon]MBU1988109.1 NAD-dependent epimerase/dehydratase family protein [Nanoarchaeota archaeon]